MVVGMQKEERLKRSKYKIFLIIVKYIPYVLMLLDILHTFGSIFGKSLPIVSYIGGTSYLVVISMILTSFIFDFCSYHRVPLYYILVNNSLILYDYYIGIPVSNKGFLDISIVLVGLTVVTMTVLYCKEKKKI